MTQPLFKYPNHAMFMMGKRKVLFVLIALLILSLFSWVSCDKYDEPFATTRDEYDVYYYVEYATTHTLHNIAHVEYTTPDGIESYYLSENEAYVLIDKVPKGSKLSISTYLDVNEALRDTKARIGIEVKRGDEDDYHEVAYMEGECPLASKPLELSYVLP
ncbi:MAG: hypothetical protein IJG42_04070 [Muribaculaceae bacterium]|nr:hypothetical protein [Muribaculaceae bacterium]